MTESGDILTPDEQLLRKPRWTGPVTDIPTAIRNIMKVHHPERELEFDECAECQETIDDIATMIEQLTKGGE